MAGHDTRADALGAFERVDLAISGVVAARESLAFGDALEAQTVLAEVEANLVTVREDLIAGAPVAEGPDATAS